MIYLSIHGIKDGKETFNCGTRYDWYLIQIEGLSNMSRKRAYFVFCYFDAT